MAAGIGDQFFVGPDNSVCTPLLDLAKGDPDSIEAVELANSDTGWMQ